MEGFICIQTFLSTLFKFSGDIEPDDIRVSYLQFEAIAIIMSSTLYNAREIKASVIIIIITSSLMNCLKKLFLFGPTIDLKRYQSKESMSQHIYIGQMKLGSVWVRSFRIDILEQPP